MLLLMSGGQETAPPVLGNMPAASDEELVAAAQAKASAFTPLYERYLERIFRFCYNRLGDRQAAEDATSEVFLQALAHLPAYRSGTFAPWLYTIARNIVIAYYRRQRHMELLESSAAANAGRLPDPAALQAQRADLLAALAQLSDEQRTAVELPAAGWSDAQIGAILGKSEAAVRMIRYRAMQRLHSLLADDAPGDGTGSYEGDRR